MYSFSKDFLMRVLKAEIEATGARLLLGWTNIHVKGCHGLPVPVSHFWFMAAMWTRHVSRAMREANGELVFHGLFSNSMHQIKEALPPNRCALIETINPAAVLEILDRNQDKVLGTDELTHVFHVFEYMATLEAIHATFIAASLAAGGDATPNFQKYIELAKLKTTCLASAKMTHDKLKTCLSAILRSSDATVAHLDTMQGAVQRELAFCESLQRGAEERAAMPFDPYGSFFVHEPMIKKETVASEALVELAGNVYHVYGQGPFKKIGLPILSIMIEQQPFVRYCCSIYKAKITGAGRIYPDNPHFLFYKETICVWQQDDLLGIFWNAGVAPMAKHLQKYGGDPAKLYDFDAVFAWPEDFSKFCLLSKEEQNEFN